jgi:hypothetical protein
MATYQMVGAIAIVLLGLAGVIRHENKHTPSEEPFVTYVPVILVAAGVLLAVVAVALMFKP